MKIGVVTSIKAPYRSLQLDEISKNKNIEMTVYYTDKGNEERNWEKKQGQNFKEKYLNQLIKIGKYGALNAGLISIVKENDIVVLGGYEKPTYILLSLYCKVLNKKNIIIFDGISCDRLNDSEKGLKGTLKKIVINNASFIWGNGTVSKKYFTNIFNYPKDQIFNQYLTIDGDSIKKLSKYKETYKKDLRNKYNIGQSEIVLQYSGRLINIKNIDSVIKALGQIKNDKITLLVTGDGIEAKNLKKLAKSSNVKLVITGFIESQEELFKHYFMSDAFILPSKIEPWGLVVNEAMFAGLPVIVSNVCGASLDLVREGENGYLIDPYNIPDIVEKIEKLFHKSDYKKMGETSENIIEKWNFSNSSKTFYRMLEKL